MLSLYCEGSYETLWDKYLAADTLVILPDQCAPLSGWEAFSRHLFHASAAAALKSQAASMHFQVSQIASDVFVLYGCAGLVAPQCNMLTQGETRLHLSCGFKATEQGLRLMILHTSAPLSEYSLHSTATDLYGAVFLCAADDKLTLLQMNESFVSLFGYTRCELGTKFSASFLDMVFPADRPLLQIFLQQGVTQETEFRIVQNGGGEKWVLQRRQLLRDAGGIPYFCCILVDITPSKKTQLELTMSLERHEIILNQTNEIIFEWDIATDRFSFSSNWEKLFHYAPVKGNTTRATMESNFVHADDKKLVTRFFTDILRGAPYVECEARIAKADGTFLWCRMRSTQQFDANGAPIKAIGVISNIDEEKQRAQRLMEKAERDTLTKLYNKGTVQALIADHLSSRRTESIDALLIIDVDNFKSVNDTEGHLFGDKFLIHIADCLNKIFRNTDLIGRIGGDEFIVLARDLPDIELARQKAEQALSAFRNIQTGEKRHLAVSCSVGIAITQGQNIPLETLYSNADWALYQAKRGGKNRYMIYEGDDSPSPRSGHTAMGRDKL